MAAIIATIETFGDVDFLVDENGFYVLRYQGVDTTLTAADGVTSSEFAVEDRTMRHAEEREGGGFLTVWKDAGGTFAVLEFGADGRLETTYTPGDISAEYVYADSDLVELIFEGDVDNDGSTAFDVSEIEGDGDVHLHQNADGNLYAETAGVLTELTNADGSGGLSSANSGESALQVINKDGGGYYTLWQEIVGDGYSVREHDANGQVVTTTTDTAELEQFEAGFNTDLNADGTIGPIANTTQTDTTDATGDSSDDGSGMMIMLAIAGVAILGGGVAMASGAFGDDGSVI